MGFSYTHGTLSIATSDIRAGRYPITVHAADWQELKNMEDVPVIKPNTTTLRRTIVVR